MAGDDIDNDIDSEASRARTHSGEYYRERRRGRRSLAGSLFDLGESVIRARRVLLSEMLDAFSETVHARMDEDDYPEEHRVRNSRGAARAEETFADTVSELSERVDRGANVVRRRSRNTGK
ncbi:hypothetical protein GOD60_29820 [Sinorhizobium medicae]|nr:hypothetical protein [Sinorhizobium medicae]